MTPSPCAGRTSTSQQVPIRPSSAPIARHPPTITGLNGPAALAFDASGNLYVANYGAVTYGTTVSVVAPGSVKPTSTLTGLGTPIALAFDSQRQPLRGQHGHEHGERLRAGRHDADLHAHRAERSHPRWPSTRSGNVYVANLNAGTVSVFAPGSTTPTSTLTGLERSLRAGLRRERQPLRGQRFHRHGERLRAERHDADLHAHRTGPRRGAGDRPNGNLYVANNGDATVSVFAPGSTTPTSTLTGLNDPAALAFDAEGNLYVANAGATATDGSVSVFAPGSTTPTSTLMGLSDPTALAFDAHGTLYVANTLTTTISVFPIPQPVASAGGVIIRNTEPGQPIDVGGTSGTGLSLSDAELAQLFTTAGGAVTIGDSSQTGDITVTGSVSTPHRLRHADPANAGKCDQRGQRRRPLGRQPGLAGRERHRHHRRDRD